MSHFTVLVSLKENTEEALKAALQPFHEYECTGIEDQYVVFTSAETKEEMEAEHKRHLKEYSDSTPKSFDEFVKDWYGYELKDGIYGHLTNPNKKWDWWKIGGRWSNSLTNKKGEKCDHCSKGDLDIEATETSGLDDDLSQYDEAQKAFNGESFTSWPDMLKKDDIPINERRAAYHDQAPIKRFNEIFTNPFCSAERYNMTREQFIEEARFNNLSTFAIIHDDKWIEKGDMGWFGCVGDEKDAPEWRDIYMKVLSEIPDDNYLVVVDCHI